MFRFFCWQIEFRCNNIFLTWQSASTFFFNSQNVSLSLTNTFFMRTQICSYVHGKKNSSEIDEVFRDSTSFHTYVNMNIGRQDKNIWHPYLHPSKYLILKSFEKNIQFNEKIFKLLIYWEISNGNESSSKKSLFSFGNLHRGSCVIWKTRIFWGNWYS